MTTLPHDRFVKCRFYAPISITNVRLDGPVITGDYGGPVNNYYGEKGLLLAQRVANLPADEKSILAFTRRYGPLKDSPDVGAVGFSFKTDDWRTSQRAIQNTWRRLMKKGRDTFFPIENVFVELRIAEFVLQCETLNSFMYLELSSFAEKLRFCEREDCSHPYFIPQHGKERYCSTDCSNWAQSNWKKQWHEKQREMKKKGSVTDGTQTARTRKAR